MMSENTDPLPEIASCWKGPGLGWMHLACLASFVKAGHLVTLYTDNKKLFVPEGVKLESIDDIWPHDNLRRNLPAVLFSDVFRLKLFEKRDVIWVDTDAYCIQPLTGFPEHIFGRLKQRAATGILRLPKNSPILEGMLNFALHAEGDPLWLSQGKLKHAQALPSSLTPENRLRSLYRIKPGIIGPNALNYYARKFKLLKHLQRQVRFYPYTPQQAIKIFQADSSIWIESKRAFSMHFYGRAIGKLAYYPNPQDFNKTSFAHAAFTQTKDIWHHQ